MFLLHLRMFNVCSLPLIFSICVWGVLGKSCCWLSLLWSHMVSFDQGSENGLCRPASPTCPRVAPHLFIHIFSILLFGHPEERCGGELSWSWQPWQLSLKIFGTACNVKALFATVCLSSQEQADRTPSTGVFGSKDVEEGKSCALACASSQKRA